MPRHRPLDRRDVSHLRPQTARRARARRRRPAARGENSLRDKTQVKNIAAAGRGCLAALSLGGVLVSVEISGESLSDGGLSLADYLPRQRSMISVDAATCP